MSIGSSLKEVLKRPSAIYKYLNSFGLLNGVSDETFAKLMWRAFTGRKLNLDNPKGFNEKLQWLKLYDRREKYTMMVDKYLAREYVEKKVGGEHLVPLLGAWENPDDIDFDALPEKFVLKCNHNSGEGMRLCKDKSKLDRAEAVSALKTALSKDYSEKLREWPYKNVKRRVIAEEFIIDHDPKNTLGTLIDYKFYCFDGKPKFLYVGTDEITGGKKGEARLSFLDLDWNPVPFGRTDHRPIAREIEKPDCLEEMKEIAEKLAEGMPFVRIDLYYVNGKILFSEFTVFPGAGFGIFSPYEWEEKMGEWITLPAKKTVE